LDTETAGIVLGAITALAIATWVVGLQFLMSSARGGELSGGSREGGSDGGGASDNRRLSGSAEVEGEARSLGAKAASLLAKGTLLPFLPVKILEKSEDHIQFERIAPGPGRKSGGGWLRQGLLCFTPLRQGRARIEWAVELPPTNWLLWAGGLFQVVGLIALVTGCWAIYTYVVSSPNPEVRWQTLQMLQVCHFLWPPFLFGATYRRGRQEIAARFEALASNLPYLEE
jgi:hypothetical protein